MDPSVCCLPALVALYKMHQLNIVDQVNCDGPVVKGKHLLQWMMAHVVLIECLVEFRYLALKELDKHHLKTERHLHVDAKS